MKYDLNSDDLSVLLVSLIGRRNNINGLLTGKGMSDSFYDSYRKELNTVDSLLERFFPGSVENIKSTANA